MSQDPARRLAAGAGHLFPIGSGGLPTRRRLTTCPTTSAQLPTLRKLCGIELKLAPQTVNLRGGPIRH